MPNDTEEGSAAMQFAIFSHIAQKETVSIHQRLREFADEARLADRLGFDYFFTTEHHFSGRFSLSPSQPISLTVLAQVTERIRFGPMVILLPISQPLRVAEELLILDHMSNGRLEIGLGRGITPHEHITYGVNTRSDKSLFNEGLEFLLKALTTEGRFSWLGEHLQYFDVELPWRPLQQPHPPIWIPTNTPATAYEYGRKGFGVGGFAMVGQPLYEKVFAEFRRGWAETTRPEDEQRVAYLASTVVADTDEEARDLAYDHFERQLRLFEYERERSRAVVDSEMAAAADASLARMAGIRADLPAADDQIRFLCGSPDTVVAKVRHLQQRLGVNVLICEFSFGELPYDQVVRSYELFADKVMPSLGRKPVAMDAVG